MTWAKIGASFAEEPKLRNLIALCRAEFFAEEIWLFGSRARGENRTDSDWDILVFARDSAPAGTLGLINTIRMHGCSGVNCDLLTVTKSDFEAAKDTVNTVSYAVKREGIRPDADVASPAIDHSSLASQPKHPQCLPRPAQAARPNQD